MIIIAGPCVIESESLVYEVAEHLADISKKIGFELYFKASFDKANRTSSKSFRGPGIEKGLIILEKLKKDLGVKILTDVHEETPIDEVASVVDVLQTPAFLCRQTNFIQKVAKSRKTINIKKGQFLSPWEMKHVVQKCFDVGNKDIWVCERGFSFGYNNLVSDMRSLAVMRETSCKVVFDATHSVQLPGDGSSGVTSSGNREFVPVLARAAAAVGVDGMFFETHPDPNNALSDGPNMVPLKHIKSLIEDVVALDKLTKSKDYLESVINEY